MKFIISFSLLFSASALLLAQNGWVQKDSMPANAERHHPVTWAIGDTAYVLTGTTNGAFQSKDFYLYDGPSDSWTTLSDFPGPARSFAYGEAYNGKGYIGFGASQISGYLNDLWEYDPETQTWIELATCPCTGRRHPAFVINDGKIYVGLGDGNTGNLNDWWVYDIATDTWGQLPNLPGPQRHHPFHFSVGNNVYAGFGHGNSIFDDWYRFNPADSSWTETTDTLPFPGQARVAGTEFSHLDKGYVLSGDGATHANMQEGEFWEYDPAVNSWTQLPSHPGAARWAPSCFVLNNTLYFLAGEDNQDQVRRDMWAYELPEPEDDDSVDVAVPETVQAEDLLKLYPNPAQNQISIKSTQLTRGNTVINIFNMQGKLVLEQNYSEKNIDIEALTDGVYFLRTIHQNGKTGQAKFIKQ